MKRFCLLMSLLFSGIPMYPQVFHKFLSKSDVSGILYRVIPASDGGYAAAGTLTELPSFNNQFLVTRFSYSGVAEWSKMMGTDDSGKFYGYFLEAGVHHGAGDDLGALVMAVEPRFAEQYLDRALSVCHAETSFAIINLRISLVPPPISVKRTSRR